MPEASGAGAGPGADAGNDGGRQEPRDMSEDEGSKASANVPTKAHSNSSGTNVSGSSGSSGGLVVWRRGDVGEDVLTEDHIAGWL